MKIAISADGTTVRMKKRQWSMTCPAADLPKWVKFSTDVRDRKGGAFAEFCREVLVDLIKAQKRLNRRNAVGPYTSLAGRSATARVWAGNS